MKKSLPEVVYVYWIRGEFGKTLRVTTSPTDLKHGEQVGVYRLDRAGIATIRIVTESGEPAEPLAKEIKEALGL